MPKKATRSASKTAKKSATKKKPVVKKSPAKKPVAARNRATSANPGRVVTRRIGGRSEVVGLIGSVTTEEIAIKAYYLAERRRNLGLPGDPESDWLQAERELRG